MTQEYKLVPFENGEGQEEVEALTKFLEGRNVDLVAGPIITPEGTLGAKVQLFKKVKVEEEIVSPIQAEEVKE